MRFKQGDEVWVYIHELNYISIYKGIYHGQTTDLDKRRRRVYYTELFFDNARETATLEAARTVPSRYIYPSFEAVIGSMNEQRVIKDILDSQIVAK